MDHPQKVKCDGCGRETLKKFLKPKKGINGLFCSICHIPYGGGKHRYNRKLDRR